MHLHTRRSAILHWALGIPAVTRLMSGYAQRGTIPAMTEAAKAFLDSLWPEQREKATFKLEDEELQNWFYTPVRRKGLPLKEMGAGQRHLAFSLLSAGLSQQGFAKSSTIMSLEEVLLLTEGHHATNRRDSDLYYFSIFGEPADHGQWGYRVEGHHLSLHFTMVDGQLSGTPTFFGTNPARVLDGKRKGLRALSREEDLGRELIHALNDAQRKTAIVLAKAPGDILTEHSREAALNGQPTGIQINALTGQQGNALQALLAEYCDNMADQIASHRREQIKKAGNDIWFAWAGGFEPGEGHYYRVQSSAFLVEYDDTQDNANHIHSVWRDFNGDFGRDLLKDHYKTSHSH